MRTFASACVGAAAHKAHRSHPSAHRSWSQWINGGSWAALAGQGFSKTIFPSFMITNGVPCIRAVFSHFVGSLQRAFNSFG